MSTRPNRFLKHSMNGRGGSFLGNWKKKKEDGVWKGDGRLNIALNRHLEPCPLWQHRMPFIYLEEKNGVKRRRVFSRDFNCHEDEATIKHRFRNKQTGEREAPFKQCPLCKFIEWVRMAVDDKKIKFTQAVLKFEGDDPKDTKVLHAGGIYGGFGDQKMSAEREKEMNDAGLYKKNAWQENINSKGKYVFVGVNMAETGKGLQITTESSLLGEGVQDVVNAEVESNGEKKGDPFKGEPYVLQFQHHPEEAQFDDQYNVIRMNRISISAEVRSMLDAAPPDLTQHCEPFNKDTMRSVLERACVLPKGLVPWEEIFKVLPATPKGKDGWPLEQEEGADEGGEDAADEGDEEEGDEEEGNAEDAPPAQPKKAAKQKEPDQCVCGKGPKPSVGEECAQCGAEFDADGYELQLCSGCEKPMRAVDSACPHCKKKYNVAGAAQGKDETEIDDPKKVLGPEDEAPKKGKKGKKGKKAGDDEIPF